MATSAPLLTNALRRTMARLTTLILTLRLTTAFMVAATPRTDRTDLMARATRMDGKQASTACPLLCVAGERA